jgi:hypothetical protein
MKLRFLAAAITLLVAGSAQAAPILVAGFDFSQFSPGFLTTDGGITLQNTLSSNYSDLDNTATVGLGNGSGFGTMHIDGQFTSFNTPLNGNDPFRPLAPGLTLNANMAAVAGVPMGSNPAGTLLLAESGATQSQFQNVRMAARGTGAPNPLNVVFEIDLGVSFLGANWRLDFAGKTNSSTSSVAISFSTDGVNYAGVGTAGLGTAEQVFGFDLGAALDNQVFVRFAFTGDNTILPSIDNVTIKAEVTPVVPEPGTALLSLAGLLGLGVFGRRR